MNRPLWDTRNDLPEKVRVGAIELLNQQFADALDLALQAKQAHWNVKGPSFIALHELFDEVVDELFEHADDLRPGGLCGPSEVSGVSPAGCASGPPMSRSRSTLF